MRWIEVIDPYGEKERVEFRHEAPGLISDADTNQVPAGMDVYTEKMEFRNTFYWDKKAMREHPTDYKKARLIQWLHDEELNNMARGVPQNKKNPLESRVWYLYEAQDDPYELGNSDKPIKVGRRLDDGSTQTNTFQYSSFHQLTNFVDSLGRSTRFIYSTNGIDLLAVHQMTGSGPDILASFAYDSQHRPVIYTDASGEVTGFRYNSSGQTTAITNAVGLVTTFGYDSSGYLTNITGPTNGAVVGFTYATNRVRSITDSEGYIITFDYDSMDRITRITYPDGTTEEFTYRFLDLQQHKDRRQGRTRNFYDANRQLIAVQDALGRLTSFHWCSCGSLESITDPLGRVTTWLRDLQGRVTDKVYPDSTAVTYTYENATSRVKSMTDAMNQTTWYEYFNDNNLKSISYSNEVVATPDVSFTYGTSYNRLTRIVEDTSLTNAFSYYSVASGTLGAGRLKDINGPVIDDTITFEYDELGRVKSRDIDGLATRYVYDTLGRVLRVTNVLGRFTNNYVNATVRLSSVFYPNGQTTSYSYYGTTNDQRLQSISHSGAGATSISRFAYTYDSEGQIVTWTQQQGSGISNIWMLEYDSVNQLLSSTVRSNGPTGAVLKRYVYGYDKAGNRTGEQIDDSPGQAAHDSVNQVTSITAAGPTRFKGWISQTGTVTVAGAAAAMTTGTNFTAVAATVVGTNVVSVVATDFSNNKATNRYEFVINSGVTTTLRYDLNGNLTNSFTSTETNLYQWDAANRLRSIEIREVGQPTNRIEFTVDAMSRWTRITEKTNGVVERDRALIWCGTELCEKRDASGGPTYRRYFPEGMQGSGSAYFYARDHLGSIRELTDASQVVKARYEYDPYGRVTTLVNTLEPDARFTGHYYHEESGLHLALFRAYDAGIGRWLSRDPLGEAGGVNLFAYVEGDPINAIDPDGRQAVVANAVTVGTGSSGGMGATLRVSGTALKFAGRGTSAIGWAFMGGWMSGLWIGDVTGWSAGAQQGWEILFSRWQEKNQVKMAQNRAEIDERASRGPCPPNSTAAPTSAGSPGIYFHYSRLPGLTGLGLNPASYVTDTADLPYDRALGITFMTDAPDVIYQYPVVVPSGVPMQRLPPVNGLNQWYLPQGTPPGTVGPASPIRRP